MSTAQMTQDAHRRLVNIFRERRPDRHGWDVGQGDDRLTKYCQRHVGHHIESAWWQGLLKHSFANTATRYLSGYFSSLYIPGSVWPCVHHWTGLDWDLPTYRQRAIDSISCTRLRCLCLSITAFAIIRRADWRSDTMGISWLDDCNDSSMISQDAIPLAAAEFLGADRVSQLAKQAESEGHFWLASLRWSASALVSRSNVGHHASIQVTAPALWAQCHSIVNGCGASPGVQEVRRGAA